MTEFEIKLEVPAARTDALREALFALGAKRERLRAVYYDTSERLLRRERLVLRTRFEQGRWVQTLKGEGAQASERLEHNVEIGGARATPAPVAARHAKTEVGERLMRVLGAGFDDSAWEPLFETDVERTTAGVDERGTQVEIAFDRGRIVGGPREVALCEIEFELKQGEPGVAVELARSWCARHRLWISTISKAQKGMRLVGGERFGDASARVEIGNNASLARIAGIALAAAVDRLIANTSELAAGNTDDERVHQARVAIRRTRTVLRELLGEEGSPEELALVRAFRALGELRDARHVPPGIARRAAPVPREVVRDSAFQDALLSLLARACRLRSDKGPSRGARATIEGRLERLLEQSLRDGRDFEGLDATRQHRVRKRLKRLRYLAESTAPLHDAKKLAKSLRRLKDVQDALGDYNDDMTMLAALREEGQGDGNWFALAWLEEECREGARECARRLRQLARARPFWR